MAAIEVRVADSTGDRDDAPDIEVLAGPDDGPPVGTLIPSFVGGLRAGAALALRARKGTLDATAQVWLAPGVNDVVMRLPGRIASRW